MYIRVRSATSVRARDRARTLPPLARPTPSTPARAHAAALPPETRPVARAPETRHPSPATASVAHPTHPVQARACVCVRARATELLSPDPSVHPNACDRGGTVVAAVLCARPRSLPRESRTTRRVRRRRRTYVSAPCVYTRFSPANDRRRTRGGRTTGVHNIIIS